MIKKIIFAITLTAGSMTLFSFYKQKDNTLTSEEKKAGWQLLFDGKTTNGWRMYQNKPADCWGVKNGELYCKGSETDKSDLRADIITKDQYENFELSIDWKIAPKGNSGIMYHVTEEQNAAYLTGPEYQLIDDEGYPDKLENWQKTGADYAMYTAVKNAAKPVGEYNTTKIVVKGAHREHWLNGVKVVEFEAWSDDWKKRKSEGKWKDTPSYGMAKKGYICLQDHGSGVWFKNIKLRKL
ncbi:3-keto-disaccharide hydrolase [Terrimonas pollutisoli]|uniref:3-keto-disaccharide hydrolase n=1 Tax=Terrimonas pollutisoli TaxID=3034147 RepID=UPI0023EB7CBF|nr:DUF1080 domain-containing protein [Terrimonas sp. H1YJ31]